MKRAHVRLAAGLAACFGLAVVAFGAGRLTAGSERQPDAKDAALASPSRVLERSFYSTALGEEMPFAVYLPPGYEDDTSRRYPVLYMLHGLGGNYGEWQRYGLFEMANQLIASRQIAPMIIVTPEGGRGYWFDQADGGPRYGSYVATDLVSLIDRDFRTLASRDGRAIGGVSMGAHGALQLAKSFPDTFSVVGAHSLVLRRYEEAFRYFGDETYFKRYDPVQLFGVRSEPAVLDTWIDIGDQDPWLPAAESFHRQLVQDGIAHTWRVYPGGHDASYWRANLSEYLRFYSDAFSDHIRIYLAEAEQK